ncbi:MAG: fibronectin type III domain-containing protein [candidate division Zixibacteria bacterium]|nr:fibronectin type III domain-containing protein [candidate division Zixibacteria bacterium]MBU1471503.1 fibronectin type III domain-containing protein [candidate division Zixibacteria bacterium]MBU2626522.1 fibronectin type III domain-containing protein [candidate division Zixibacteria bacterium]
MSSYRCLRTNPLFSLPIILLIIVTALVLSCEGDKMIDPVQDRVPPATTQDLAIDSLSSGSIRLNWTAPGDDSMTGQASQYDIRYSTTELDSSTWDFGTSCTNTHAPSIAGDIESFAVTGLEPMTKYYFALRTSDESHNWSEVSNTISAKTPDTLIITWERTYGGSRNEWASAVLNTAEGYLIAGLTASYGNGYGDMWLVHVDPYGEVVWQKTYGTGQDDQVRSMIEVSDGYVLAGESGFLDPTTSFLAAYIVRTDLSGNEIWSTRWLGLGYTLPWTILPSLTTDGYVVMGWTEYYEFEELPRNATFIISIDEDGRVTDSLFLDDTEGLEDFGGRAMVVVSDGYLIGGTLYNDPCIVKLSADLTDVSIKPIAQYCVLYSMADSPDGGAIAVGQTDYSDVSDLLLMKISESGDVEWSNSYSYGDVDVREDGYTVASCPDGGYVATGLTMRGTEADLYMVKVDSKGRKEWDRRYGEVVSAELGLAPTPTPDGGYLIAGSFWPNGLPPSDLLLIKTDAYGGL